MKEGWGREEEGRDGLSFLREKVVGIPRGGRQKGPERMRLEAVGRGHLPSSTPSSASSCVNLQRSLFFEPPFPPLPKGMLVVENKMRDMK